MRTARWLVLPAVVIIGGCASTASSNVPIASEPAQTVMGTTSPSVTASPLAAPSSTATGSSLVGELVSVVTDDLVVRSRPGTGADSEIYPARLNAPLLVYIIDGPEEAEGFEWYLVDPLVTPCYFGCDLAPQPGWVAAAAKDGERWLAAEPARVTCPEPTLEGVSGAYPQLWLYCFGHDELTLSGGVVDVVDYPRPGWPWARVISLYGSDYRGPIVGCVDVCNVPLLTVAYDGEDLPTRLSTPSVSGHFDDSRASECRSAGIDLDQRVLTHNCRMVFVVTSWN